MGEGGVAGSTAPAPAKVVGAGSRFGVFEGKPTRSRGLGVAGIAPAMEVVVLSDSRCDRLASFASVLTPRFNGTRRLLRLCAMAALMTPLGGHQVARLPLGQ